MRTKRFFQRILVKVLLIAFVLSTVGCADESMSAVPAVEETITDPEITAPIDTVQGMNKTMLMELVSEIQDGPNYPDVHSLLVMRHGKMVLEWYFNGSSLDDQHTLQSVTKSFGSAAIGVAIEQGLIEGVHEKMIDFFPNRRDAISQDTLRSKITLEDMLTMRAGTDYNENGASSPHFQLNALTSGWDDFWLNRPMINEPGTFWRYDSGGVITLSAMLKERYGHHADTFLENTLFSELGITDYRWVRNLDLHPHLGGGLFMTARDMLKFGQLYLNRGKWDGKQVVPESWIDQSLAMSHTFNPPRGIDGRTIGYGYLWWILSPDPAGNGTQPIYAALGYRGQHIFVVPEHDMVVVVTAWLPPADGSKPISFFYSDILPAILE
jgi:CubicO group peptidase (beta-lactamase class C family)